MCWACLGRFSLEQVAFCRNPIDLHTICVTCLQDWRKCDGAVRRECGMCKAYQVMIDPAMCVKNLMDLSRRPDALRQERATLQLQQEELRESAQPSLETFLQGRDIAARILDIDRELGQLEPAIISDAGSESDDSEYESYVWALMDHLEKLKPVYEQIADDDKFKTGPFEGLTSMSFENFWDNMIFSSGGGVFGHGGGYKTQAVSHLRVFVAWFKEVLDKAAGREPFPFFIPGFPSNSHYYQPFQLEAAHTGGDPFEIARRRGYAFAIDHLAMYEDDHDHFECQDFVGAYGQEIQGIVRINDASDMGWMQVFSPIEVPASQFLVIFYKTELPASLHFSSDGRMPRCNSDKLLHLHVFLVGP